MKTVSWGNQVHFTCLCVWIRIRFSQALASARLHKSFLVVFGLFIHDHHRTQRHQGPGWLVGAQTIFVKHSYWTARTRSKFSIIALEDDDDDDCSSQTNGWNRKGNRVQRSDSMRLSTRQGESERNGRIKPASGYSNCYPQPKTQRII